MIYDTFVDLLRCSHLMFFAAGMGTSLYFDFRTLYTLKKPISERELKSLYQIHVWITYAFAALWITGFGLIYIRTGFVLEAFSPKLYAKLIVMSLMVMGRALLTLPVGRLALITQIAVNSMFCWTAGLTLGASTVLKTAPWDVLIPLGAAGFVAMSVGGHVVVALLRWWHHADAAARPHKMQVPAE